MKATAKTGRPNVGLKESVIFKMTEAEKETLDKYSEKMDISKAEILRQAFQAYMKKHAKKAMVTIPMFE